MHRRRFISLKYIFPALAFFVLLLLFLFPQFKEMDDETKLKIPSIDLKNPALFQIEGARFFAYDLNGRPFSIEIKKATEKNTQDNIVFFEIVEGEIRLDDENWVVFQAGRGHLDLTKKILFLFDSVSLMSNAGYYLDGDQIEVSLDGFKVKSDAPVVAHGDFGNLQAAGFSYIPSEMLHFTGPIKTTLLKGF